MLNVNNDDILGRKKIGAELLHSKDFIDTPHGRIFKIITPYGIILYTFDPSRMKKSFERMIKIFISKINGLPADEEDLYRIGAVSEGDRILDMEIEFKSEAENLEVQKITNRAIDYFNNNLPSMFKNSIEQFVLESHALSIMRASGEGYLVFSTTESETFIHLSKIFIRSIRERMKINNAKKKPVEWTNEKLLSLLENYESIYPLVKQARKIFEMSRDVEFRHINNSEKKSVEIIDRVKMAYPEIDEKIIDKFNYKDMTNSDLAIEMLMGRLDIKLTIKSVSTLLVKARKIKENRNKK